MPLKLDSPLFGDSASGSMDLVGTYRTTANGTFLVTNASGNPTSVPATATIRACFATAKAAHSALVPYYQLLGGRWRLVRDPLWPAFWTQWLIDNPACLL